MCRAVIAERFPDHDVLAEELSSGRRRSRARRRTAGCSIRSTARPTTRTACRSSARRWRSRSTAAPRSAPSTTRRARELFTAERGEGAFLNGTRLQASTAAELIDALLVTGFPYDVHKQTADLVAMFGAFLGRARAVRRLGSAALDLCYVAAGRFDGFWEQHLKPWDVAAGALIVTEAGGRVTGMDGSPFDPAAAHLVASNGRVHDAMLDVIARIPPACSKSDELTADYTTVACVSRNCRHFAGITPATVLHVHSARGRDACVER